MKVGTFTFRLILLYRGPWSFTVRPFSFTVRLFLVIVLPFSVTAKLYL